MSRSGSLWFIPKRKNLLSTMGKVIFVFSFYSAAAAPVTFMSSPANKSTCVSPSATLYAKEVNAVRYQWELNTSPSFAAIGIVVNSSGPSLSVASVVKDFTTYYVRVRYRVNLGAPFENWGPVREISFGSSSQPISEIKISSETIKPQYSISYEVAENAGSSYAWIVTGGEIISGQGTAKVVVAGSVTDISVTEQNACGRYKVLGKESMLTRVRAPEDGAVDFRTIFTLNPVPVPGITDSSKYWIQVSKQPDFSILVYDAACNGSDSAGGIWHPVWGTARMDYYTKYYMRVKVNNGAYGPVTSMTTGGPRVFAINPAQAAEIISGVVYVTLNTAVGAQQYFIEMDTTEEFNSSSLIQMASAKNTFPMAFVKFNQTYFIRARANALQNGVLYQGNWDKVISFSTIEKPVTFLSSPVNGTTNWPKNATIYCYKIPSASSYDWELSTSSDFSSAVIAATKPVNYVSFKSLLADNTTYYVRVKAHIASQSLAGDWGPVYSFSTAGTAARISLFGSDDTDNSALVVSPNPFKEEFHLSLEKDIAQLTITNALGKTVAEYNGEVSNLHFGLELEEGVYILTLMDIQGNTYVKRLVKIQN